MERLHRPVNPDRRPAEVKVLVVRGPALLALVGAILTSCVPLYQPGREALDGVWNEWMLTGHYGFWRRGGEKPWGIQRGDRISAAPGTAGLTRYAIEVWGDAGPFANSNWSHTGGLVGRVETENRSIELFGKQTVLVHYPSGTASYQRDYSYEFFFLIRPRPQGRATLVRKWSFAPEDVALVVDRRVEELLRRSNVPEAEIERLARPQTGHNVEGFLTFDAPTKTATVTIKGLKQPFEERVDLSQLLQ
jgi:hypothetical protein